MSESETTHAVSAGKEPAAVGAERYAHGSDQIAEACAAAIYDEWEVGYVISTLHYPEFRPAIRRKVVERIAKTLDAIHASSCEGRIPNA